MKNVRQNRKVFVFILLVLVFLVTLGSFLFPQNQILKVSEVKASSAEYWGNQRLYAGSTYYELNHADRKIDFRFTAQESNTVDKLWVSLQDVETPPNYTIGLQGDDSGLPDESWLGKLDTDSWTAFDINIKDIPDVALTQGTVYHLVIQYKNGTIGGSNYIEAIYDSGFDQRYPYNYTSDTNLNVLIDTGVGWWSSQTKDPRFNLEYTPSGFRGVWTSAQWNDIVNGSNYYGEDFTPENTITVSGVELQLKKVNSPSTLYVVIYNKTDSSLVLNETVTTTIGTEYSWESHVFSSPQVLLSTANYQVFLQSPDSDSSNYYVLRSSASGSGEGGLTAITWQSSNHQHAETTTGTVPLDTLSENGDVNFRFVIGTGIDNSPPTWTRDLINTTMTSRVCKFTVKVEDNINISSYTFGWNYSGLWQNDTTILLSPEQDLYIINVTKTLDKPIGTVIGWNFYVNDTSDNWVHINEDYMHYLIVSRRHQPAQFVDEDWLGVRFTYYGWVDPDVMYNATHTRFERLVDKYHPSVLQFRIDDWWYGNEFSQSNYETQVGIADRMSVLCHEYGIHYVMTTTNSENEYLGMMNYVPPWENYTGSLGFRDTCIDILNNITYPPIYFGIDHEHCNLRTESPADNLTLALQYLKRDIEGNFSETQFFLMAKIDFGFVWGEDEQGDKYVDQYSMCAGTNAPYPYGDGYDWCWRDIVLGGRPYGWGMVYGLLNWNEMKGNWTTANIATIYTEMGKEATENVGVYWVDLCTSVVHNAMLNETEYPDIDENLQQGIAAGYLTNLDRATYYDVGSYPAPECGETSLSTTLAGQAADFTAEWTGLEGLSHGILSHNASDTWTNRSAIALSGTSDTFQDSFTLPSEDGKVVGYRFYANDTLGQWGDSGILTLTITSPPVQSQNTASSLLGEAAQVLSGLLIVLVLLHGLRIMAEGEFNLREVLAYIVLIPIIAVFSVIFAGWGV